MTDSEKYILVTGGAGYIGSHTVVSLLQNDYQVVVLDNLVNSDAESLRRVADICGKEPVFIEGDIRDKPLLGDIFQKYQITSVIHFAALKAVGESTRIPLDYYQNNVTGALCLLESMLENKVTDFIFSSSATVYGPEADVPYNESMKLGTPSSPYGMSKLMIEQILADVANANPEFRAISLRYFNPIGAHESGNIGEDPSGIPNNLMPFVSQVAIGKRDKLSIFGDDYPTDDGTCERDYLHVMDLAEGHVAALDWLFNSPDFTGVDAINLGTGSPVSVLNMVTTFEQVTGQQVPYEIAPRRDGDLPAFWADASKAKDQLNWQADRTLAQMMEDTWRWQSKNPKGYSRS